MRFVRQDQLTFQVRRIMHLSSWNKLHSKKDSDSLISYIKGHLKVIPTLSGKNVVMMWTLLLIAWTTGNTFHPIFVTNWDAQNHKLTSLTESYFNAGFSPESVWWQISTFIQWFFSEGVVVMLVAIQLESSIAWPRQIPHICSPVTFGTDALE